MDDDKRTPANAIGLAFNNSLISGGTFNVYLSSQGVPPTPGTAHGSGHGRRGLPVLEDNVVFEALLKAIERFPAPKCDPDTRQLVLQVVKRWIYNRDGAGSEPVMWLSGAPGVGKSAILQTICEMLEGRNSPIHVSHFFGRGQGKREKAFYFPATAAYQLGCLNDLYLSLVTNTIGSNPAILRQTLDSQFKKLLLDPIASAQGGSQFQPPITIVIDALDEIDNVADQVALLELIILAATKYSMRFLVASRPEQPIYTFFQRADVHQHVQHVRLDEETFRTSRDIFTFLSKSFARIRQSRPGSFTSLPNGEDWPGLVVLRRLTTYSDAQFIFPQLIVESIEDDPFTTPDEQLQSILDHTNSEAFSKLDALYHQILSRCLYRKSPGGLRFKAVLVGVLQVVISWPQASNMGTPLSISMIAAVLDEKKHVVENIIRGPTRSLFKLKDNDPDSHVALCHKSLRDCVLNPDRAGDFFVPSDKPDSLFEDILSRPPPADLRHTFSRKNLTGVLHVILAWPTDLCAVKIADVLDISPDVVQNVLHGPQRCLFFEWRDLNAINFTLASEFCDFLQDGNRAGEFYIPSDRPDPLFSQILSRASPNGPHPSYSTPSVMAVFQSILAYPERLNIHGIGSLLNTEPDVILKVIRGPQHSLFRVEEGSMGNITLVSQLSQFLQDPHRSGQHHIPKPESDSVFLRILSLPPPSNPQQSFSRHHLMRLCQVILAWPERLNISVAAGVLDVDPDVVRNVIYGPQRPLFNSWLMDGLIFITFSNPGLPAFLLDPLRSGQFCVHNSETDGLFSQILSCSPPNNLQYSYSRRDLMGVLQVLLAWPERSSVDGIAVVLQIEPDIARNVMLGPHRSLFRKEGVRTIYYTLVPQLSSFLGDPSRSGQFYIPMSDKDALFVQILSRPPPANIDHSYSPHDLSRALRALLLWENAMALSNLALFLDLDLNVMSNITGGPHASFFNHTTISQDRFVSLPLSIRRFLRENKACEDIYRTPANEPNELLVQVLSRPPPIDPRYSFTRQDLIGVLQVLMWQDLNQISEVASLLRIQQDVVHNVLRGPQCSLFDYRPSERLSLGGHYSLWPPIKKLIEGDHSGQVYVSNDEQESLWKRILLFSPPTDPQMTYSRRDLLAALRIVCRLPHETSFSSSTLAIVLAGPHRLFFLPYYPSFFIRTSRVRAFFLDSSRSGEFYLG